MNFKKETFVVGDIVEAWKDNSLQRNDEYQRGETWNPQQKQALIDSILRGYPIPSIFLHRKSKRSLGGEATVKHEVVDGQQRIIALSDFLSDKFALLDPHDKKLKLPLSMRDTPVSWARKSFSMLGPDDQQRLKSRELDVYILDNVDHEDQVRDLFIRLQSGTALTRQQIRDAWPGAVGPFIEGLAGKLDRRPAVKVFGYVDGRGTRDDENDTKDAYVKHRTTCAQVIYILLVRVSDPVRVPTVGAVQLDALYHEQTNLDVRGETAQLIREVLDNCDRVCGHFDSKSWGRKKLPKVGLFCLAMFFQDVRKNPQIRLDNAAMRKLSHFVSDDPPSPPRRTTEGANIRAYYDEWRNAMPADIGISLDPRRHFTDAQKHEIWDRAGGFCEMCQDEVTPGDEEYDHYPILYRDGGRTEVSNGRLVHSACHPRGRFQYTKPD